MPACGILRNHDEKNTTYIIARFDSVLQGIWVQNYSADDGKVLLEMSAILRDVSRALYFDLQSASVPRGRYEDAVASSTEPRGFCCTCGFGCFDLQSAIFPRGRYEVPIRAAFAKLTVLACLICSLLMSFVYL